MLLTMNDVAERLGVSRQRVLQLNEARVSRGLPQAGQRIGRGRGMWLFTPEDVELLRPRRTGRPRKGKLS